jgi:hypothetical protein
MKTIVAASTGEGFRAAALVIVAAWWLTGVAATAQIAPPSALIPANHWVFGALRRVETLARARSRDAGASTLSHGEVIVRLRNAAEAADPITARLASEYLDRFLEELPLGGGSAQLYGQSVTGGFSRAIGRAAPGDGYRDGPEWTGAITVPDQSSAVGGFFIAGRLGPVGIQGAGNFVDEAFHLDETHGLLRMGPLDFWGGRRTVALGPAAGVVLSGSAPFTGGGFELATPIQLPWILRYLGPFHFETFVSRIDRNGRREKPWFWAARGSVQPATFLTFGINRAALFGGVGHPLNVKDVATMLVGAYGGDSGNFENQVVSVDGRLTIRGAQPLDLYVEWGSDDSSGMWWHSPAITFGAKLPTLAGLETAFAGVEVTRIAEKRACCNTHWYNNAYFGGSWAMDDVPLGHALGGKGVEGAVDLGVDAAAARWRTHVRVFGRERGEKNTFAPQREGRSFGFTGESIVRIQRVELRLQGGVEDGTGWQTSTFRATARVNF